MIASFNPAHLAGKTNAKTDYPKSLICTMEYKILFVEVQNSEGNPLKLDSFVTIVKDNGQILLNNGTLASGHAAIGNFV